MKLSKSSERILKKVEDAVQRRGEESVEAYFNKRLSWLLREIAEDLDVPYRDFLYFHQELKETLKKEGPVFTEDDYKELWHEDVESGDGEGL